MNYEDSYEDTKGTVLAEVMLAEGLVEDSPPDGEGCNAWNYRTVISLMASGVDEDDIRSIVRTLSSRIDKAKLEEETSRSLERAEGFLTLEPEVKARVIRPKRPHVQFDYECLLDQVEGVGDPWKILEKHTDECGTVSEYLSKMFHEGESACILRSARYKKDLFYPRDFQRPPYAYRVPGGEEGVFFLNNPVQGVEVGGSWRSKACVTEFRHLVLECDHQGPDMEENWLKYLITLPLSIKSIVTSGGKSIHAIVDIGSKTECEFDAMVNSLYEPLVMSGADPNSLTPVRLTRLPYSFRGKSEQELLYVKAEPGESIEEG